MLRKGEFFVQFLCPKFALTYVEFALTSSRYSYGINPIVGIRLYNVHSTQKESEHLLYFNYIIY